MSVASVYGRVFRAIKRHVNTCWKNRERKQPEWQGSRRHQVKDVEIIAEWQIFLIDFGELCVPRIVGMVTDPRVVVEVFVGRRIVLATLWLCQH